MSPAKIAKFYAWAFDHSQSHSSTADFLRTRERLVQKLIQLYNDPTELSPQERDAQTELILEAVRRLAEWKP